MGNKCCASAQTAALGTHDYAIQRNTIAIATHRTRANGN